MSRQALRQWRQHTSSVDLTALATHVWGPDARGMAEGFDPTDSILMKYQHTILDFERVIRNRRVMDVGCNHGLWSYLCHRHGARHVLGMEPRGMFVDGLNAFAEEKGIDMEFVRGYDTDVAALAQKHNIDTVLMMGVDDLVQWEKLMYDLRGTRVEWVVMQNDSIPDTWVEFDEPIRRLAESGLGMPIGFTLHYKTHNTNMRVGMNPLNRDQADPETGYQHVGRDGEVDLRAAETVTNKRSRYYTRNFLEHAGYEIVESNIQKEDVNQTASVSAPNKLYHWLLLRNPI